ncbi:MAG: 2-oxoglutarate oxidoreductase [Clostridia bacterium]|nr:2-oxoglutarate oxidoreductase [Clostridia bacterium]MBQ6052642.1 2-oxoglutarate oxidoreductase [Clostridia bacterium]
MSIVFQKTKGLTDAVTHYCPGCTHGIVHRLVGEALEELGLIGDAIGVAPVGCSVMAYNYFSCDMVQAPHGRAPAVATGLKRALPDNIVFTYQGDGDLAAIGTAETVHSATRGENITVIFINNAIYGMTGGQMAPTTLPGQVTQTTPYGRDVNYSGYPVRVCEMVSTLDGVAFAQRVAVNNVKNVNAAKAAIKKAFEMQINKKGFSIVEVLSTCSTNWGMTPVAAMKWLEENMIPYYPLGVYKDKTKEAE